MEPHENNTKDRGPWMLTYSGNRFFPCDPRKEDFRINDIARSLSKTCRYNGHTPLYYSVAEHCVHLANWFLDFDPYPDQINDAKWAWAHDGAESYIGDMIRPIKWMFPDFTKIEKNIESFYFYDFLGLTGEFPDIVKNADTTICNDERFQLWKNSYIDGQSVVELYGHDKSPKLGVKIEGWDHQLAYEEFINMYHKLWKS